MLSRTAENLYWLARYMERAETMARLLEVGYRMGMMPSHAEGYRNEWASLIAAAGAAAGFAAKFGEEAHQFPAHFLILNAACPRALLHCASKADFHLNRLSRAYGRTNFAHDRVRDLLCETAEADIDAIIDEGLHEFLTSFVKYNAALGRDVADGYLFGPQ